MKTAMSTREIVGLAILIVLNILFADVLAIPIAGMQFDFGFISAAAMGMIFGANKSALASGISDIMGALILPHGTFFVGFTISAIFGGYICGKFLHDKPVSIKRSIMLSAALSLVIDLLLNSTWLYFFFMNKPPFIPFITSRLIKLAILIPLQSIVLYAVTKKLLLKINNSIYQQHFS